MQINCATTNKNITDLPEPIAYWRLDEVAQFNSRYCTSRNIDDAIYDLDSVLRSSVADQMVADVPLGSFLSGGIDSSLITALMQHQSSRPIKTFTIGFSEASFNEAIYSKKGC